jgi:integrase
MATFRQRGGRWQAIIRRVDLKATKSFDRLTDAKSWARAKEREADLGHMPGKMAGTLGALIDKYERDLWKEKRWGANKANELKVLRRDLGDRDLSTFSQSQVLAYIRGLGIAPSTASIRLSYLKEVLKAAKDLWGVQVPLEAVQGAITVGHRRGFIGKSSSRDRRPTPEEIADIIEHCKDRIGAQIDLDVVVRFLSVMPLRLGELAGIGWDDLVPERRSVILRGRKHPDIREKEKAQEVPLIAFGGVDTYKLVSDRPRYMSSPFPYKPASISSAFILVGKTLGIKDLHLHDLRAHAISKLLEAGVPIPQVALMSGHRSWKILAKHYARIDPQSVHDTLKRMDSPHVDQGSGGPSPP